MACHFCGPWQWHQSGGPGEVETPENAARGLICGAPRLRPPGARGGASRGASEGAAHHLAWAARCLV
eukprot:13682999-Alexandrium_andersonii.AAC.1